MNNSLVKAIEELIDAKIALSAVTRGGVYAKDRVVQILASRAIEASLNLTAEIAKCKT